jgi:hypothetical protein
VCSSDLMSPVYVGSFGRSEGAQRGDPMHSSAPFLAIPIRVL